VNSARGRAGILVQGAVVLVALLILLGLGTWQIERKTWKEALIATVDTRLGAPPIALPPSPEWAGMNADNSEFTRVRLRAKFCGDPDALVYASSSMLRDDVKSPGWFVFTPVCLPEGSKVVVNRGYAPGPGYLAPTGSVEIVGALRWPERSSWFVADHDSSGKSWYVRDQRAMAKQLGWGAVAPFYVEQESPVPLGGVPHPAPLTVHLRNDHLQYAITWYGLAAALMAVFVAFLFRQRSGMSG
jgi:surfeit locus 1 family protein